MHFFQFAFIRQICIFIPISFLLLLYGFAIGWNGIGIPYFKRGHSHIANFAPIDAAFIGPFLELGRFSGAIPAGILGDVIGRKGVIYLCSSLHLAAWTLKVFASSKYVIYLAQVVSGLGVGTGNAVLFIYAGEIAPTNVRGAILSTLYSFYYFGILCQFMMDKYLQYTATCYVSLGVALLSFILAFFIKESPLYLLSHGKIEQAQSTYKWLHSTRPVDDLNKEFEALKEYVGNQRKNVTSMFSGFADSANRKSVMLVFNINFLTQMTGQPAIIAFVRDVFERNHLLAPSDSSIVLALAQLVAGSFSTIFVDRMGRRKMYQVTGGLCVLSHVVTAILFLLPDHYDVSWIYIVSVSFYACVFAAGLGPLTVIVRGELLPQSVKGIGSGLAVVSAGISCFTLLLLFEAVATFWGLEYNFIFFTANCIGLLLLVYFKLPETKHRTLAEIQDIWRHK